MANISRQDRRSSPGRRRSRGVVYIEALLVIAVLIVIFAAVVFVSAAIKAKLESFDRATAIAFKNAEDGCGPPLGGSYSIGALLAKRSNSLAHPDPAYLGGAVEAPPGSASLPIGSTFLFPGKVWNFSVNAQLLCNEKPITRDEVWAALNAKPWAINGVLKAGGF